MLKTEEWQAFLLWYQLIKQSLHSKLTNYFPYIKCNCEVFWAFQWALVSCVELHSKGGSIQRKMMPALVPYLQSNRSTLTTVPTSCLRIRKSRSVLHLDWK